MATCAQIIVVKDTLGPILSCVGNMAFSCAAQVPAPNIAAINSLENCPGEVTITVLPDVITDSICTNHFTITRTYVGTDACGNTTTYVQVFMINDQTPPAIQCPSNTTVSCQEEVPVADIHTVSTTDNCGGNVTVTVGPDKVTSLLCPNSYVITRTYTATDECGNTATCAQTITVLDTTPPDIDCPNDITVFCNDIPAPSLDSLSAVDNCSGTVTLAFVSDVPIGTPCNYIIERTYSAMDECGNVNTCVQQIFVIDTVALPNPISISVTDITVQCYGQDSTWNLPVIDQHDVTVAGGCMENPTITFTESAVASDSCELDGYIAIYTYNWTATDSCGNTATAVSHLTIIDTIPPVILGVPGDITVSPDAIPPIDSVYATDECLCACVMLITQSELTPGCLDGQVITRTWKSIDACGNVSMKSQRITIHDNSGPTLSLVTPEGSPINNGDEFNFNCSEGGLPDFMVNFDAGSIIHNDTIGNVNVQFQLTQNHFATCDPGGVSEEDTFTWVADDACGNEVVFSFVARLFDDEAPEIIGVPDYTCLDNPGLDNVEATDNCSATTLDFVDVTIDNPCGVGEAVQRTYTAVDACGNISTDIVTMIPDDDVNPQMSFIHPELIGLVTGDSVEIECNAHSGLYTSFGPADVKVLAECPHGVQVNFEEDLISTEDCTITGHVGYVRLLWTATDYCGNSGTIFLIGTIVDETPPVILDAPDITVGCQEDVPVPQATDNCSEVAVIHLDHVIPGDCDGRYDIHRSITAIDQCGNTSLVNQIIHVGNDDGPVMEGIDTTICDDLSMPVVTAFDECLGVFVPVHMSQDTLAGTCHDGIVIRRIWVAEDECGDITEVEQFIIIGDTTAPVITIPAGSVILQFIGQDTIPVVYTSDATVINQLNALNAHSVIIEDDCDQQILPAFTLNSIISDSVQVDGFTEQRHYSWIAVDACGNGDTIDFTVNIIDNMPPVVELPHDITIICAPLPAPDDMTPADSTDIFTVEFTETTVAGDHPGEFIVTRIWKLTDASGNVSVVVQHITWIPDSFIACEIIIPDQVECNSRWVHITSDVTGGFAPYTYLWDIQGEDCIIQSGQHTPDIYIYVGWTDVHITLYVTDAYGCLSICQAVVSCIGDGIPYVVVEDQSIT
jgi:hypothetical protein